MVNQELLNKSIIDGLREGCGGTTFKIPMWRKTAALEVPPFLPRGGRPPIQNPGTRHCARSFCGEFQDDCNVYCSSLQGLLLSSLLEVE